jgi:predicted negative regulator of RcsB-dependent stress response
MSRNILYLIIGALVVAVGAFGYNLYQERQKAGGIDISIDKRGVSIEKK